ncbi:MAG TPA: hypothetical protein VMG80_08115 [Solirubrobacteraceae bacterium]|nr:hypothetical protein [Solirubrobacteraceae bacterium]
MPEQHFLCVIVSQLDRVLDHHLAIRKDVMQLGASIAQDLPHQDPTMTLVRPSAATQQRDAMLRSATQNPVDRGVEDRLHGHPVVQRMAVGVELVLAARTPAKRRPHERVANAARPYRRPQLIAIEVRRIPGVRMRPHVHQIRDLVASHKVEERLDLVVRMSHGPHYLRSPHRLLC